jgi:hypothetical protein
VDIFVFDIKSIIKWPSIITDFLDFLIIRLSLFDNLFESAINVLRISSDPIIKFSFFTSSVIFIYSASIFESNFFDTEVFPTPGVPVIITT